MESFLAKEETINITLAYLQKKVQTRKSLETAQIKINKILGKLQDLILQEKNQQTQKTLSKRLRELTTKIKDSIGKCITNTSQELTQKIVEINLSDFFKEPDTMANRLDLGLAVKLVDKFAGSAEQLESWIADVTVLRTHEAEVAEASFLQFMRSRLTGSARGVIDACATVEAAYTALRQRFAIQLTPIAVQAELKALKQKKQTIADFGAEVEKLATKLAAAHVSQGTFLTEAAANPIVQPIAVNTFINGLSNRNAAFLTLSRNPNCLTSAVSTALEVNEKVDQESAFWAQGNYNSSYNYSGGRDRHRGGNNSRHHRNRGHRGGGGRGNGNRGNGNHHHHNDNYRQNDNYQRNDNPRHRGRNQRRGAHNAHVAQEVAPPQQQQQPQPQPRREEANLGELFRE